MATAELVLESLRRGTQERSLGSARERLVSAIRDGRGHITVIGTSEHEASLFVESALEHIEGFKVAHSTVRISPADLDGQRVLLVVHHAESADVADLETLRMVVEGKPGSVERVRMVLIGLPALAETLAKPEARALASRIGAHVRLPERRGYGLRRTFTRRDGRLRHWPFAASAAAAITAIVSMSTTDLPERRNDGSMIAWVMESSAHVGKTVRAAVGGMLPADATDPRYARAHATSSAAARALTQAAGDTVAGMGAVVSGTGDTLGLNPTDEQPGAEIAPRSRIVMLLPESAGAPAASPSAASPQPLATGSAAEAKPSDAPVGPTSPASDGVLLSAFSSVASMFVTEEKAHPSVVRETPTRESWTAAASRRANEALIALHTVFENVVMMRIVRARTPQSDPHASFVQVGEFAAARGAFSLKSTLAEHFDSLAVARFDPDDMPVFSVRIFDDEAPRSIAAAAAASSSSVLPESPGRVASTHWMSVTAN